MTSISEERASSSACTWLGRGLVAGTFLGAVESVAVLMSGYRVPLTFVAIVLATGAGAGLLLGLAMRLLTRGAPASGFHALFPPMAAGLSFVFLIDKVVVLASYRGFPTSMTLLVHAAVCSLGAGVLYLFARGMARTRNPELSFRVAIFVVCLWLVVGRVVTKSYIGTYFSTTSIAFNLGLVVACALAVLFQDRWLAGRSFATASSSRVVAGATVLVVCVWALHLLKTTTPPLRADAVRGAPRSGANNVLLVSIDTLRADRLSLYGYERETTPHLERLARDALVFTRAVSPASWTLPAHASMLTGRLPSEHGAHYVDNTWHEENDAILPALRLPAIAEARPMHPETELLAEIAAREGYRTAGIVANSGYLNRFWEFSRGFELYDDRHGTLVSYDALALGVVELVPYLHGCFFKGARSADEINEAALDWLDDHGSEPFFLFVNYMDTHVPLAPPPPFLDRFPGRRRFGRAPGPDAYFRGEVSTEDRAHVDALYDGGVAFVDHAVGQLLDRLRELGVYEDTMVIVTSDHGEFLGEHDMVGHGYGPYEEVYRVPLIVKHPDSARVGRVTRWTSTISVFDMVVDALGAESDQKEERAVVSEQFLNTALSFRYGARFARTYRTLYRDGWKLVRYDDGSVELYDLLNDPSETTDVSRDEPELVAELQERLGASASDPGSTLAAPEMDAETLRNLEALGYLQ